MMGHFNYKPVLKWTIAFAIFVFLGKMVWDQWSQVKDTPFTLRPVPFILSSLIFAASYFVQVWAWYLITRNLKIEVSLMETARSWFYSQLGKYLPGKIWLLLGRITFYESRGKPKRLVSVAIYIETVTVMIAGGMIFLAALVLFQEARSFFAGKGLGWMAPLLVLAFASIHPRVLERIVNWALFLLKREPVSLSASYGDVLRTVLVCIVAWLVGGLGFYLFVDSITPMGPESILFLTGSLAVASTLGLIAVFAPSGLGVREGALVYLLSFVIATPVAVIVSVLTRIWMTLIEIGLIGVIYLLERLQRQKKKETCDKA